MTHRAQPSPARTPRFAGTLIPVATLFDYLLGDESVSDFLRQYPSVSLEQVEEVLAAARVAVSEPS